MFRLAYLALHLVTALSLAWWDAFTTSWADVGEEYASRKRVAIVGGVRVKLLQDDGDAWDAPNRGLAGIEGPGVGGNE